jgi:hypothetical protein
MDVLRNWSGQDEASFAENIKRYTTRANAELYLQSSLGFYKDQRYPTEQLTMIERSMRDILNRTYFEEEETQGPVSGLASGRVKKDPKTYNRSDWEKLEDRCKVYPFLNIRVKGSDAVRVLKVIENRNKNLTDTSLLITGKGKIKWDVIFDDSCKDETV